MIYTLFALALALGLFLGMLACCELGYRTGLRRRESDPDRALGGVGVVDSAVFALLGLLVAFTFSGALNRFDARRSLIVQEANAIRTAYLRLDTLPVADQPALRALLRSYVDSRLTAYRLLPDLDAALRELERSEALQGNIWTQAVASATTAKDLPAAAMLLPALNTMFEVSVTRTMAARTHPPVVVFVLLFGLALGCSALAGYGMAAGTRRNWSQVIAFSIVTAVTVYVILDLEHPRVGLIRVDAFDAVLSELRQRMR